MIKLMKSRPSILLLLFIFVCVSCAKREWNNPFDPNCPKDYWTPTDFKVSQEGGSIKLTWKEEVSNFSGFRITKQVDTGTAFSLDNPAKGSTQFSDASLTGGKVHTYSLIAYAGSNESDAVTAQITPVFAPTLAVPASSSITSNSVVLINNITSDGGVAVTGRGVCWSINQNPTISDNKTTDGTGNGSYNSTITGLSPGTVYYIRAYATNSVGTSYSSQLNSTTNATLSSITTSAVSSVGSVSVTGGGVISADGGAAVTARGVCWNTTGNPTVTDTKTTDGSGIGGFTSSITGLTPATTYYIRAYATNSIGTTYGDMLPFITLATLPTITTGTITNLTATSLSCGGNISSDGGSAVTMQGVCWSTNPNPTTADSKTTDGTGTGLFSSSVTGLTISVTYYIRAYAINSIGTAYGNVLTLKTSATLPTITTGTASILTSTTATCGGNITNDGGSTVTLRGVCWSTSTKPTTADSRTSDGSGNGIFSSSITGLSDGSTYYIRAYAVNGIGTTYGNEVTIVASLLPSITTIDPSAIKTTSVQSGGNITSDGGSPVTARGLCWSTSQLPTIANSHTNNGSNTGAFISNLTGLTANTLYFVRAYATNTLGTSYGKQFNFVTSYGEVTDADGNIYQTIKIGNQVWMRENLKTTKYNDGTPIANITDQTTWSNATSGAFCWYNNDAANYKNVYGALYNGYTINTNKLAPAGWHIPTQEDFILLQSNSGGFERLKESGNAHWIASNFANNLTGFTALPGGQRETNGTFNLIGTIGKWWTTVMFDNNSLSYTSIDSDNNIYGATSQRSLGLSVRCILGTIDLPVVSFSQSNSSDIMLSNATIMGIVTDVGGPMVTSRGICWSITNNPTISDSKTFDGSGYGSFKSLLTGLSPGKTYICRFYATNSAGTSYSYNYSFTTLSDVIKFNSNLTYGSVSDIDGNLYKTIAIGQQTWFAENLRTTKYNDGTAIPQVADKTSWSNLTSGAYCYYNNDESIKNLYGALYNWYTVSSGKLCPIGWHVSTDSEWVSLSNVLGIGNIAGGALKEVGTDHWRGQNGDATNALGFTALPGGFNTETGEFSQLNSLGLWWSSTGSHSNFAWLYQLNFVNGTISRNDWLYQQGNSVRCVKD